MQPSQGDSGYGVPTILFAEDDPMARELIGAKLRARGYRVVEAETGDAALPLLRNGGIDVLVTDISMPGARDGWSLAEEARRLYPRIAVVYSSSAPADALRQVSASLYLRKPYPPDAIVAAIRQLTGQGEQASREGLCGGPVRD